MEDILLGKTISHLVPLEGTKFLVHRDMLQAFQNLQRQAKSDGFDLQLASAFRSYDRQLKIWNSKAAGERVLLDDSGQTLDFPTLPPVQVMNAILRWSALPGSSRHHWGTDIDVFNGDTQVLEEVKLIPAEVIDNGPAASLHDWLDEKIQNHEAFGFFRPYQHDLGGVSPERWHLSFSPLSQTYFEKYTLNLFRKNILKSEILLKEVLLENAEEIYQRYFLNISLP